MTFERKKQTTTKNIYIIHIFIYTQEEKIEREDAIKKKHTESSVASLILYIVHQTSLSSSRRAKK